MANEILNVCGHLFELGKVSHVSLVHSVSDDWWGYLYNFDVVCDGVLIKIWDTTVVIEQTMAERENSMKVIRDAVADKWMRLFAENITK